MRIISGNCTRPSFNLAMEEYALYHTDSDYFMIWQNAPSIIVGRNQNTLAEINYDYVKSRNIPVVRRLTGGGAVFHDLGNINYTFIKRHAKDAFNDYAYFAKPVIAFLHEIGAEAELSGRNDILIKGRKISGNAQCAFGDSVMHHGTLLFSSDISELSDALNVNPLKVESKGIRSVRSRVTNISENIPLPMTVGEFKNRLTESVKNFYSNSDSSGFSDDEIKSILQLEKDKYSTWDWNFGFEKPFTFSKQALFPFGIVEARLNIADSYIVSCEFFGDFFGTADIRELCKSLEGIKYDPVSVSDALARFDINSYFCGASAYDIVSLMF